MLKQVSKRFLSITLAILMALSLFPTLAISVLAATNLSGLNVSGLTAQYDNGTWTASGTTINGSATGSSDMCGNKASSGTLILENSKSENAELSFDYSLTLGGGTITIDGESITASGHFEKTVESGDTVSIAITTQAGSYTTSIEISNLGLVVEKNVTTTFFPSENGSFTVDGVTVTEDTSNTQLSTVAYSLSATPTTGYKFMAWYNPDTGSYLNTKQTTSIFFEDNQTVTALFVEEDLPVFETASVCFTELNQAITYAQEKNASKITLISSGLLPAGEYIIPSGITLLIPFDEAGTCYTTTPATYANNWITPYAYKTLTLEPGANITVNGALSVSAKVNAAASSQSNQNCASPDGPYGYIHMQDGSNITVNNGGALYCWGYISGDGDVMANSGASVYENFQITDFRGGSAIVLNWQGTSFPFTQWYVQNIEANLTLKYGASETVYTALYMNSAVKDASITLIGNSGMFRLAEGSSLSRTYDTATDRVKYAINGSVTLSSITVGISGMNVNSASYRLPLNCELDLEVLSGTTTISQDLDVLPSVTVKVNQGATLKIDEGTSVYLYDIDDFSQSYFYTTVNPVKYSPTRTGTRTYSGLTDAALEVDGTLQVDGALYTTARGANIYSNNDDGNIVFTSGAGSATTVNQVTQSGSAITKVDLAISSAKLHNADDSYTETSEAVADDVYTYIKGTWTKNADAAPETVTVVYDSNEGVGTMEAQTANKDEETTLTANTLTRDGYDFIGWNTAADGSGTSYADAATVILAEDITLYAQWQIKTFNVTWVNEDGSVLETDYDVAYGTTPSYDGNEPAKEADVQYTYSFAGWTPALVDVTSNVTYTAQYNSTVNKYTVTWMNGEETLLSDEYEYGQTPAYSEIPTKDADAQYTYVFSGWDPEIVIVTGDATYSAQFSATTNSYTVTWQNWDGSELGTQNINYGETPKYSGESPTREATSQYSYEFSGWDPSINAVTGNVTYTAVFTETLRTYTVTWTNWDGTVLETDESVEYGSVAEYNGETPSQEQDVQYTYTFNGWTPDSSSTITGDTTYTAQYTATTRTYTIKFLWEEPVESDGPVMPNPMDKTYQVAYGEMPQYVGSIPMKAADAQYTYTFSGWNPKIVSVTGDATYIAQYTPTLRTYTVYWQNWNTDLLEKDVAVEYGKIPTYDGDTPTKTDKQWFTYTFSGWTPEVSEVTGEITYTATFSENGMTGWQTDENGKTYVEDGLQKYFDTWAEVEGETYFFNPQGYVVTGLSTQISQDGTYTASFIFDENGVFQSNYTGLYDADNSTFWAENGELNLDAGLVRVLTEDGEVNYYYFRVAGDDDKNEGKSYTGDVGTAVKNTSSGDYWITKTNGMLPEWGYQFDENGVIVHYNDTSKNGIIEVDGTLYYFIDGITVPAGLIKIDEDYYYVNSKGQIIVNQTYFCSRTNSLMEEGTYAFDENGKMIIGATEKNGIVAENGSLYYYVNGELTYAGLIQLDGAYYYVNSRGEVINSCSYYITWTHGLKEAGCYTFDSEGRLIEEAKNGIVAEDGSLYYYVNGVLTYAGLIEIDGDYYYINSNCEVVHDCRYYITWTHGLKDEGYYTFDTDGKLVEESSLQNGIVEENDSMYYYVNGVITYVGLIKIGEDYYYVRSNGEVVHDCMYYITWTHGLMDAGYYYFDSDGKLSGAPKNGIVEEEGSLYYYVNDVRTYAGLIEIEGDYYYVRSNCEVVHDTTYCITWTHGLMDAGYYTFDSTGKMIVE